MRGWREQSRGGSSPLFRTNFGINKSYRFKAARHGGLLSLDASYGPPAVPLVDPLPEATRWTVTDRGEDTSAMAPLVLPAGSPHRGALNDLALELAAVSSGFRRSLRPRGTARGASGGRRTIAPYATRRTLSVQATTKRWQPMSDNTIL